jgi:hypothetical protein
MAIDLLVRFISCPVPFRDSSACSSLKCDFKQMHSLEANFEHGTGRLQAQILLMCATHHRL